MSALPPHAHVLTGLGVTIEDAALDQLGRVAGLPGCCRAVGLPDLHPGRGVPVGAAFAFRDRVVPALIGGDIGCGVRLVAVKKAKFQGDALLRRVDEATRGPALPDADPHALLAAVWAHGPAGLAAVDGVPDSLAVLAEAEVAGAFAEVLPPSGVLPEGDFGTQLGTAGGGNHFLELSTVERVQDRAAAAVLGLTAGTWVVLAHSGSRGLGASLAARHREVLETPDEIQGWLADQAGAIRFALANRVVLAWRLLEALGAARPDRLTGAFDLVHNAVVPAVVDGAAVWLHRKGAAPAALDQPTVVLGSRGAPSHVLLGAGREDCLASVAHGAGRRLDRADAAARFRARHTRASLRRTTLGSHVLCDDAELLFAEHPDAYKAVEPVVAALEAAGAGRRVATLVPHITIKR